jgi:hypothetical protein
VSPLFGIKSYKIHNLGYIAIFFSWEHHRKHVDAQFIHGVPGIKPGPEIPIKLKSGSEVNREITMLKSQDPKELPSGNL